MYLNFAYILDDIKINPRNLKMSPKKILKKLAFQP